MHYTEILTKTGEELREIFFVPEVYLYASNPSGEGIETRLTLTSAGRQVTLTEKLAMLGNPQDWCLRASPMKENSIATLIMVTVIDGRYVPPGKLTPEYVGHLFYRRDNHRAPAFLERQAAYYNEFPIRLEDK